MPVRHLTGAGGGFFPSVSRWGMGGMVLSVLAVGSGQARGESFDHGAWDGLLGSHVREGWVDYEGIRADRAALDSYLARVAEADTSGWPREDHMAFWINVYNARMVASVLDHWPLENVLHIGRILFIPSLRAFKEKHRMARGMRSLDDVEHGILRARFRDPRVHAVLVCASKSCPALASRAYRGETLDAELDRAMDAFLQDPRRNQIFADPPRLSRIFKWYGDDFRAAASSVWEYVRAQVSPRVRAVLPLEAEVEFLPYDWSLNRWPVSTK